ncbi:MAG: hypothetical protein D6712_11855 [Chloroflexi bacterium]|nr:MAG: hypothetical protein D6712_11855 [Chloroflexota bacterium]
MHNKKALIIAAIILLIIVGITAVVIAGNSTGTVTAYYYGETWDYYELKAAHNGPGMWLHCVARPNESIFDPTVELDCYDTIEEANQKVLEYRPDLEGKLDLPASQD